MSEFDQSGGFVAAHPHEQAAVIAWSSLHPSSRPTAVASLRAQRGTSRKAIVCRLYEALPDGSSVIAKRCAHDTAALECRIQQVVLPLLRVSRLEFYGAVGEGADGTMWLFMEDAGDAAFITDRHVIVAQWLAQLHTAAADSAAVRAANLPNRGLDHYRDGIQRSCRRLRGLIEQWVTSDRARDRAVLQQNLALLEVLDARWSTFAEWADVLPSTLTHGDFTSKNIRVSEGAAGPSVYVFDWEMAGWGSPAADIACLGWQHRTISYAVLDAYASAVCSRWPTVNIATIQQADCAGTVMRCIAAIDWEICSLGWDWDIGPISTLKMYAGRLHEALVRCEGLGWS